MATGSLKTVAVLGTTGYIGRSLLGSAAESGFSVTAFSRDPRAAEEVLSGYGIEGTTILDYGTLEDRSFDIIINASGIGSPRRLRAEPALVFSVTEEMDEKILRYLKRHKETRVFNLSSGSVYGLSAGLPLTDTTLSSFDLKNLRPGDYYSLAKLISEAKHRAVTAPIIDLRIFAFVSRYLDIEESFFIAEVGKCLLRKEVLYTKPDDMVRDFATAHDIWDTVRFLSDLPAQNAAFDIKSRSPVGKFELLSRLQELFGLRYEIKTLETSSPTGEKSAYYSQSEALTKLGFNPNYSAIQNIERELGALLAN